MTTSAAYAVGALLDKMTSPDKDFRFMAVNDLSRDVNAGSLKLDEDSERKVARALLKLLSDKNGEVQNLSVKCLGMLTQKLREPQVELLVESLCKSMVGGSDEERDVSSLALKNVVNNLGSSVAFSGNVMKKFLPVMNEALVNAKPTDSVRLELLDVVADILLRFGPSLQSHYLQTRDVIMVQLQSDRQALRKRATVALANLTATCSSELFSSTVEQLILGLKSATGQSVVKTLIIAITSVIKASGSRFSKFLPEVLPLIQKNLNTDDEELKEALLQSYEAAYYHCSRDMLPFHDEILRILIDNLSYDPNYSYGTDDEDETMEADEDDEEEEEEDYSDDDDMSWKVRRAAAKGLEALVMSRSEDLLSSLSVIGHVLINRLKEREENVRADIFSSYISLLRQTKIMLPHRCFQNNREDTPESFDYGVLKLDDEHMNEKSREILNALNTQKESLLKAISKQVKSKSVRTRLCCFELLSELVRAVPNSLDNQFSSVMPSIAASLTDKLGGAQMRIDALQFLSHSIRGHDAKVFEPHLEELVELVGASLRDSFYKVVAEALFVATQLISVIKCSNKPGLVCNLYEQVFKKLNSTDIDQDVKERAITAAGQFYSVFGDLLRDKAPDCMNILLERIRNEMTRLTAVRSIGIIAKGTTASVVETIIPQILPLLAEFLRKNNRSLKIASLHLIEILFINTDIKITEPEGLSQILIGLPAHVKDSDLQVTQLVFRCISAAISRFPGAVGKHLSDILQSIYGLLQSALLQGISLNTTLNTISTIVSSPLPNKPSFEILLDQMTAPIYDVPGLSKQAFLSISSATAVVAAATKSIESAHALAEKLADQLNNRASGDNIKLFCLHTMGELGRRFPVIYENSSIEPAQILIASFDSTSEELKTAAAQAIGALAAGNLDKFLPFILEQIQTQPKRQYLLLHSLKEVIGWESSLSESLQAFQPHIEEIWPVLINHTESQEEGTRNIVAECLGKLCQAESSLIVRLKEKMISPLPSVRGCVVNAVKFMITPDKQSSDDVLRVHIADFLTATTDVDLSVRRTALIVLNSAAHNKPGLIRELLPTLLPAVYTETKVRPELIREVEMGPFKHQVDGGLDLRKSAFECMYTFLGSCLEKMDVFEFISHMEDGLKDSHDIRLLSYLMLIRISALCPSQVLQRIEKICEPLKNQLNVKAKPNAVKQEIEKMEELKRGAIRTIFALQKIPDAERHPHLIETGNLLRSSELRPLAEQVQRDAQRTFSGDVPMETV